MSQLMEYKCPACGGVLAFDSGLQKMRCPYCDSVYSIEELDARDEAQMAQADQAAAEAANAPAPAVDPMAQEYGLEPISAETWGVEDGMRVWSCNSCGAQIVTDATTAATACPYCNNNIVMPEQFAGDRKPDLIIPFKLDKEAAKNMFRQHARSHSFVPRIFKQEAHINEIKGVYIPYWLYSADGQVDADFIGERSNTSQMGNEMVTRTESFRMHRDGVIRFEDVPVDGSAKMNDELTESIEPFNVAEAVPFKPAYLAGYLADRYDVDADAGLPRALERMRTSAGDSIQESISGYDSVKTERADVSFGKAQVRYALFPTWVLSTRFQDKDYLFAMNAQTGKFVGDLPFDKTEYYKKWGKLALIIGVVLFVITKFLGLF